MNLPNFLTLSRIILSPVFLILMPFDSFFPRLIALIVFAVAALTDLADGYYARKMGDVTSFGRFMDPIADKILVSIALLTFISLGYVRDWMVIIIVVREFLITGMRSMAAYMGEVIKSTLLAKWKTATQMIAISIIMAYAAFEPLIQSRIAAERVINEWLVPLFGIHFNLFDLIILVPLILTVWTGIHYLVRWGGLFRGVLR
jgi:CDP-diacylglycerol--glycerol-3-phosphate 3-phosphatidyltransferase